MSDSENRPTAAAEAPSTALAPARDTRFKAGVSGNPGGRPRIPADVKALLLEGGAEAMTQIMKLAQSAKSESVRLAASVFVVERILGKAVQPLSGPDGGPIQVAAMVILPGPLNDG